MNHLFGTNFREMDAFMGRQVIGLSPINFIGVAIASTFSFDFGLIMSFYIRSQTTKGIWLANCAGIEPCTIVMDLEGTDGRERGEVSIQYMILYSW